MAFLIYRRSSENGRQVLRPTGEHFSLAGRNLLFQAWEALGRPTNKGWRVDADDLIKIQCGKRQSHRSRVLVIDFHPGATHRIGLIELLEVYAFTWSYSKPGSASWTPLMLRLRDLFYREYSKPLTDRHRTKVLERLLVPKKDRQFVEFLYLNGDDQSWNWGKNGATNAVFIQDQARDYFRKFF